MSNIGRVLHGYCAGYFGRDSYRDKVVIAEGYNWVVCYTEYCSFCEDSVVFASFSSAGEKANYLELWSAEEKEEGGE